MSTTARDILEEFDRLPESKKHEVADEILRRTRDMERRREHSSEVPDS